MKPSTFSKFVLTRAKLNILILAEIFRNYDHNITVAIKLVAIFIMEPDFPIVHYQGPI